MAAIGIVIVTYNSAAHIGACLDSTASAGADVVVVDNASQDATCAEVTSRGVRLIANDRNLGFAAAVNQGIRALAADYILLLNPDAALAGGLDALRACCDRPNTAGAGGKLLDSAGRPQSGFMFRRFPTPGALACEALLVNRLWHGNPVNRRYRCLDLDPDSEQIVEQPAGAFLMIRRDVWAEIGGFDEGFYPIWFEDVDFARRAEQKDYRMFYSPRAVANHTGGHSMLHMPLEIRAFYWYRSLLRYAGLHFPPWQVRGVSLAILMGAFVRMLTGAISEQSWKPIVAYSRVIGLAGRYLVSSHKGQTERQNFQG